MGDGVTQRYLCITYDTWDSSKSWNLFSSVQLEKNGGGAV